MPQVHRTMWAVLGLAGRWRIVMHQSGLHQRVSNMVRHYREQSDGLEVAPAILLGLYCAVAGCFGVWSVRPSSAYAPFKSQPVRVPISTRNDCDLCAIAPIERCTAADPLGRSRGAATGNDRHNGAVAERRPKTPSAARTGPMPSTSRNRSGLVSMTSNTFSPKARTSFLA